MGLELNIAICDDEKYYRNYVENVVRDYLIKEDVLFQIELFVNGEAFCEKEENIQKFDIIFLDIEMDGMNGMETAYYIREKNPEIDIVFITVTSDYVFEGYNVRAVRYIMKKEIDKSLPDCLANIIKTRKCSGHRMEFPFVGGKRVILLDDLLYIESRSHKLQFRRKGEILYMYGQINELSGQITKETTKLTKNKDVVKNYSYDSAGNKSTFSVQVGDDTKLSLQYSYDGESKLTTVTDENGSQVVEYAYDSDGNLSGRSVPENNLTTTYTYDYQNRLTAMRNQTGSAGVISQYTSEYLANGQKSKENTDIVNQEGKKSTKTATYTYDLLGRIRKETKTGSEDISYTYDSNNNRKEMTVGNKVTAYKYNKNDELLRTDTLNTDMEEDSVVIYKYDKNGNQLATVNRYEIPSDRKDDTYVDIDVTLGDNRLNENVVNHYNALNQLTQTLTKNYKVSFTYDAEGLRASKTVNGEKTVFVWDGDQLVMELSEGGKVQKRYIRGNDLVYADKGTETEKQYYVTDPHGNVVQLIDESGAVTKTYEYDSFGNELSEEYNSSQKDQNPWKYDCQYFDVEMQTYYMINRYYNSGVGRFIQEDPIRYEENSGNYYTYAGNDPIIYHDPDGLKTKPCKVIGGDRNDWCELYKSKSFKKGRIVKIPSSQPDRNGWNSFEDPDNYKPINPYADKNVKKAFVKGSDENHLRTTKKGHRYAVAVGPVVLSKKFSKNNTLSNYKNIDFAKCYGKKLDVEIKKGRKKYYIRCAAGDTKAHTYPNGVYQTGESYEEKNPKVVDPTKLKDTSVIEFIGYIKNNNQELNKYKISRIIVYDNKKAKVKKKK